MTFEGPSPAISGDEEFDRLVLLSLNGEIGPQDRARLDALAAADPAKLERAIQASRAWVLAGLAQGSAAPGARHVVSRRALIAAGLGVVIAAPLAWRALAPQERLYQAAADAPLHAVLEDGTHLALSRGGRLAVYMSSDRRAVRMIKGAALWSVAKDRARPFQIRVAEHSLTVLGTRFNVEPTTSGLRIDLLEGSLRVEHGGQPPVILKPGQRYWADHTPLVAAADVDASAAWLEGRLIFDDADLADVASRLRLYTGRGMTFADRALARTRFSGVLNADDPESWRPGLEAVLPVQVSTKSGELVISKKSWSEKSY